MATLLEIVGLERRFGGVEALAGVDLVLGESGLLCVIGPNGCGKTTLFDVISGHVRPDSGRVRLRGRDITGWPRHRVARAGIGRKFQIPAIYPELSVADNLAVARLAAGRTSRRGRERQERLLASCRLDDKASVTAGELAHGERQWLEIAMVIASEPRLMLLDEPTAGMGASETEATAALVRRLHAETGIAALVIEHDLAFVQALACEVAVMIKGRILRRGGYETIRADPLVREAYLGRAGRC